MTFVEAFYGFNLEITHTDRDVYEKIRLKTPKHPHEPLEHLYARILAFAHCYEPDQVFTHGLFQPEEPTIWRKSVTGELLLWTQVGCPPAHKLKKALRAHSEAHFHIYFFEDSQVEQFCSHMRGSRNNWVENVHFHRIDPALLQDLLPLSKSSSDWSATIVDGSMYLVVDDHEFHTSIPLVDIWDCYQQTLNEAAGLSR